LDEWVLMEDVVYRGSKMAYQHRFAPRVMGGGKFRVFAFTSPVFAALFAGEPANGFGFSFDVSGSGVPVAVERYPRALDVRYGSVSTMLHTLSGEGFTRSDSKDEWKVASWSPPRVFDVECIEDLGKHLYSLRDEGRLELYIYPNRPVSISKDDHDLVRRAMSAIRRNRFDIIAGLRDVQPWIFERVEAILSL